MGNIQSLVPSYPTLKSPPHSPRKDVQSTQEDVRAEFYEHYRKEADEYDKEFIKRHDEDLNTTLIFVRLEADSTDTC